MGECWKRISHMLIQDLISGAIFMSYIALFIDPSMLIEELTNTVYLLSRFKSESMIRTAHSMQFVAFSKKIFISLSH